MNNLSLVNLQKLQEDLQIVLTERRHHMVLLLKYVASSGTGEIIVLNPVFSIQVVLIEWYSVFYSK